MQDPRFVSSPFVCMQNILILNEYDLLPVLNSYICRIQQSIPNWNTLFKKRLCICCSADVATFHRHRQLVPSYNLFQTGILSSKKAVHLLQCRCPRIPQALLVVSTLVPYTPPGVRFFVCRLYFTLFLSTKKFVAGQIKNIVLPPPLPPHRLTLAATGSLPPPMPRCRHGGGGSCRATKGVRAYP